MSKHTSQIMTLSQIIELADDPWYQLLGLETDEMRDADENGEDDDWQLHSELESELIDHYENTCWEVSWPDHVVTPQINSDANFHMVSK